MKQVGAQELCFLQWIISRSTTSFDKVRIIYQANEPKYDGKSNSKPNNPKLPEAGAASFHESKIINQTNGPTRNRTSNSKLKISHPLDELTNLTLCSIWCMFALMSECLRAFDHEVFRVWTLNPQCQLLKAGACRRPTWAHPSELTGSLTK